MKKIIVLIVLSLLSCKQSKTKEINTLPLKDVVRETKYVNAKSGLNYRNHPNGKVLGKFPNNVELNVIKSTNIFEEIKDEKKIIKGEWVGVTFKNDTVYVFDAFLSPTKNNSDIWSKFPLKNTPLIDSTNFDNIKEHYLLDANDIAELQLKELYPNIDKESSNYKFHASYKLNLGDFNSIVINVFKGDHELESVLIIYDSDHKLIKVHQDNDDDKPSMNALVIAYDEIAEGWSRKIAKINDRHITTIDALYTDTPVIDTLLHHINNQGLIKMINTTFTSTIRSNQILKLNTMYTDTIQFIRYNDDSDYFFLEGIKNNKEVSMIYNWDWNTKKYNFKKNDFIKIKWKIDSIHSAGDGETLDFHEFVIDAENMNN